MARKTGSHSETTGPRVRAVALRLFAQNGFAAVSMRKIAAEVGVQAGALYSYTPDKQTLLFDLMRGHMEDLLVAQETLDRDADTSGNALARLAAFTGFHIQFHAERPDEVFISYMELRNLTRENFAIIEGLRRRYEDKLEEIIQSGIAQKEFAVTDSKVTTMAVIAMLTGVNTWFRSEGRLSLGEVEEIYRDMVCKSVLA